MGWFWWAVTFVVWAESPFSLDVWLWDGGELESETDGDAVVRMLVFGADGVVEVETVGVDGVGDGACGYEAVWGEDETVGLLSFSGGSEGAVLGAEGVSGGGATSGITVIGGIQVVISVVTGGEFESSTKGKRFSTNWTWRETKRQLVEGSKHRNALWVRKYPRKT